MDPDRMLRRKWTFRAHGRQVVVVKHSNERAAHVLMKVFLWALYLPDYPTLTVEMRVGDRFKPDVVAQDEATNVLFWGEAGQVGLDKIRSLAKRYRATHLAIAKWDMALPPLVAHVTEALEGIERSAPFDLLSFPADSAERFLDERGHIALTHADVVWVRLGG